MYGRTDTTDCTTFPANTIGKNFVMARPIYELAVLKINTVDLSRHIVTVRL